MEVQISPCERAILRRKRYLPGKWLSERAISNSSAMESELWRNAGQSAGNCVEK